MSDIKLRAARQLIAEEQTAAARRILETMPSNETARGWLARLKEMTVDEPEPATAPAGAWEYLEVFVNDSRPMPGSFLPVRPSPRWSTSIPAN